MSQSLSFGPPSGQTDKDVLKVPALETRPDFPEIKQAGHAKQNEQTSDTPPAEPKSLTADDITQAKMLLLDGNAKSADKIQRFKQIHETYRTPDGNALDELELPPVIRNTVDLAIQNPKQTAFAAELLGVALSPDTNDDSMKRRLGILAGTNAEARNLLEMFRGLVEQGGGDPYNYLAAALGGGEDEQGELGDNIPGMPPSLAQKAPDDGQREVKSVFPVRQSKPGRYQGLEVEEKADVTAFMLNSIADGKLNSQNIDTIVAKGLASPDEARLAHRLLTRLSGDDQKEFRAALGKIDANLGGVGNNGRLRACAVEQLLESSGTDDAAVSAAIVMAKEHIGYPAREQVAEIPGAVSHTLKSKANTISKLTEDAINYVASLRIDPANMALSPEQLEAIYEYVDKGGTEENIADIDVPLAASPLVSDPEAPKVASLPRVAPGEPPKTTAGKATAVVTDNAADLALGSMAFAPAKTLKNTAKIAKGALIEVGMLPKAAQAAMYKSPAENINAFVAKYLTEKGKQSYFTLEARFAHSAKTRIDLPSDTVLHSTRGHPDLSGADWANLAKAISSIPKKQIAEPTKNKARYGGKPFIAHTTINNTHYGFIFEKVAEERILLTTYFKGTEKELSGWFATHKK